MATFSESLSSSLDTIPGVLRNQVLEEFRRGYHIEAVKSAINNRNIGIVNRQFERKSINGVGRLRMSIDPTYYHHFGQMYGYDCWRDKQFLNDVEKINPQLKVKCGGTKVQVGFGTCGEKRSSTKYNL